MFFIFFLDSPEAIRDEGTLIMLTKFHFINIFGVNLAHTFEPFLISRKVLDLIIELGSYERRSTGIEIGYFMVYKWFLVMSEIIPVHLLILVVRLVQSFISMRHHATLHSIKSGVPIFLDFDKIFFLLHSWLKLLLLVEIKFVMRDCPMCMQEWKILGERVRSPWRPIERRPVFKFVRIRFCLSHILLYSIINI